MKIKEIVMSVAVGGFFLSTSVIATTATKVEKTTTTSERVEADNTAINERDRREDEVTADQQSMTSSDTEITRKIRQALVADDSLSTYAHNIKIITQNGLVTLKGPVRSSLEKNKVEAKAVRVAGRKAVTSEVQIAK